MLNKLVDGVLVEMSEEEEAEIRAEWASNEAAQPARAERTKAQLLAEISALTAQVQALP